MPTFLTTAQSGKGGLAPHAEGYSRYTPARSSQVKESPLVMRLGASQEHPKSLPTTLVQPRGKWVELFCSPGLQRIPSCT